VPLDAVEGAQIGKGGHGFVRTAAKREAASIPPYPGKHTPDDYNVAMKVQPHGAPRSFEALVDRIDAALPQTQCQRCGYPACRPYAESIARGEAAINRCPPGGEEGVRVLARITGHAALPLDPACGVEAPPRVALIDEDVCIGCTKCIQACPVDAIVGASKLMHTVVADLCTGCELCVTPCPVDCIAMVADPGTPPRLPRPALPCPP
jgi:electron transport complex protein RnfB